MGDEFDLRETMLTEDEYERIAREKPKKDENAEIEDEDEWADEYVSNQAKALLESMPTPYDMDNFDKAQEMISAPQGAADRVMVEELRLKPQLL